MSSESWLIRDDMDRERMLDMDQRVRPVRKAAFAVMGVALAASGPWLGFWILLPLAVAAVFFAVGDVLLPKTSRPEYALFAAWAISVLMISSTAAMTGGARSPLLPCVAIPVATLSARFSTRGVVLGVVAALGMVFAVALSGDLSVVIDSPPLLIAPVVLIVSIALLTTALMGSDVKHRSDAVLDPLTGLLNRNSLASRAKELTQGSALTHQPVGLIVGDVDHFKKINDSHGHPVGDAVLQDIAYLMRKELRAFDLLYRIGGEEFLVLLPGADKAKAVEIAEYLCATIASEKRGGQDVTMSFGVSGSASETVFDYESVFAEADEALYEAKRSGRNRVCSSGTDGRTLRAIASIGSKRYARG